MVEVQCLQTATVCRILDTLTSVRQKKLEWPTSELAINIVQPECADVEELGWRGSDPPPPGQYTFLKLTLKLPKLGIATLLAKTPLRTRSPPSPRKKIWIRAWSLILHILKLNVCRISDLANCALISPMSSVNCHPPRNVSAVYCIYCRYSNLFCCWYLRFSLFLFFFGIHSKEYRVHLGYICNL